MGDDYRPRAESVIGRLDPKESTNRVDGMRPQALLIVAILLAGGCSTSTTLPPGTTTASTDPPPPSSLPATTSPRPDSTTPATPSTLPPPTAPPTTTPPPAASCDLTCETESSAVAEDVRLAVEGGAIGFLLKREGEILLSHNADVIFYPASAIKVVHLVHALGEVETDLPAALAATLPRDGGCAAGGSHPAITLDDALTETMKASSNETANALNNHFGFDALAMTIADAGMTATELHHGFGCGGPANDPANRTTAQDLVSLFEGVASGELLSHEALDAFYTIILDETAAVLGDANMGSVFLKEGWYGNTLTVGGVFLAAEGNGSTTALPFAAFVYEADRVAPDFDIKTVVSEMLLQASVVPSGGGAAGLP